MTATLQRSSPSRSGARVLRALVLAAAAAAATVAGVYVAGGLITNDFRLSMALTGAWFLVAGACALASLKAGRSIGAPIVAGYLVAALATGGYLAATTLRDRVVDETVVTGMPATELPVTRREAAVNVQESSGRFRSGEHATRGTARIVRLANGRRVLTLTSFDTAPGPDLRVRVVPGDSTDGGADRALDLGALKGNRGDQQYALPAGFRPGRHTVLIWCRAFSALFGSARLERS
jgi:Electron transfer DM13